MADEAMTPADMATRIIELTSSGGFSSVDAVVAAHPDLEPGAQYLNSVTRSVGTGRPRGGGAMPLREPRSTG